jgi:hypothetical protein
VTNKYTVVVTDGRTFDLAAWPISATEVKVQTYDTRTNPRFNRRIIKREDLTRELGRYLPTYKLHHTVDRINTAAHLYLVDKSLKKEV